MGDNTEGLGLPVPGKTSPNVSEPAATPAAQGDGAGTAENQQSLFSSPEAQQFRQQLLKELSTEAQAAADRAVLGQRKRVDAAIKNVEATIENLTKAGHKLDPATQEAMKEQARQTALADPSGGPSGEADPSQDQAPSGDPQPQGTTLEQQQQQLEQLQAQFGTASLPSDPEAATLSGITDNAEFLAAYPKALIAKLRRTGGGPPAERSGLGGLPGGVVSSNNLPNNPDQLLDMGIEQANKEGGFKLG